MTIGDSIIKTLNTSPAAKNLNYRFRQIAKELGLKKGTEEYRDAEITMLMLAMLLNKDTIHELAADMYYKVNV